MFNWLYISLEIKYSQNHRMTVINVKCAKCSKSPKLGEIDEFRSFVHIRMKHKAPKLNGNESNN